MRLGLNLSLAARQSGGAGVFSPDQLPSLVAWYVADEQPEAADAPVSTFIDQHGAFDFAENEASVALLRHNAINGRKALDFSGADSYTQAGGLMNGAAEAKLIRASDGVSLFA